MLHLNLGRRFAAEAHSAAMAAAPVGDERSHGRRPVGVDMSCGRCRAHFGFLLGAPQASLGEWQDTRAGALEAGDGIRTHDPNLGKVVPLPLSYARKINALTLPGPELCSEIVGTPGTATCH